MSEDLEIDVQSRGSAVFRELATLGSDQAITHLHTRKSLADAERHGPYQIESEEDLIPDERAELRPSQWVERKLVALLSDALVPVSHIRLASVVRGRRSEN
jgi:hypothetical protein